MKTFRMIGMALMAVLMCVNFASCSEDDDLFSGGGSNIPKNTIRYQTTDGERLHFKNEDVFGGARIVKHTYSTDDWWVLEFSSNVTAIEDEAFYENHTLLSIILPNNVTSIGNYAFSYCSALTSITIPNSVTSIGYYAFYDCSDLTSLNIPNSVTSVGEGAFHNSAWYNNQPDGIVYAGKVLYEYKGEMPSSTSINIKEGTSGIGSYAFRNCTGLTSIKIPNSVTSIGDHAFYGCSGLTSINIPNSVTSIENWAFIYCSGLTSIVVEGSNAKYDSRENCNAIIETATNTLVAGCKNSIIPQSVTSIGDLAFCGCSGLTSVTIPNSVTSIGESAFYGCSDLTSVTIPNSVTSIGNYAFNNCSGLTSITIGSGVTSIGTEAFYWCRGLKKVVNISSLTIYEGSSDNGYIGYYANMVVNAPNGSIEGNCVFSKPNGVNTLVKYIGDDAELTLPKNHNGGNYVIGDFAFYDCSDLTSVIIPNSVTSIGNEAFVRCSSLTSVTIGNRVKSIGYYAFYDCSDLTSVIIPNSVTSIGERAFSNCI